MLELVSPTDNSTNQSIKVELIWKRIKGAKDYKIQLSESENFDSTLVDSMIEGSSYTSSQLKTGTTYFWRVKPFKKNSEGPWSETWQFTTTSGDGSGTPPATLVSPSNESSGLSISATLEWEEISGISEYQVELATSSSFTSPVVSQNVSQLTYNASGLQNGQTYYWRVQAGNDGDSGNWSTVWQFTTTATDNGTPSVTLVSPSDGASGLSTSATLEWEEISGISEYQVELATSSSFTSPVVSQNVSQLTYNASGLQNGQTYYWRVQADNDGDSGNWSTVWSFTTESSTTNETGTVAGDREALMDLYEATGGSNWSNDSGWGSGNPSDSWYGITVNSQGRVIRIDLSGNNLSGSLPASIGNLSKVAYFNVKQNNMTGQIPSSVGQMTSLTHLLLNGRIHDIDLENSYHPGKPYGGSWADERSNNFTGQIPSSIGNLQNLQWFEMSGSDAPGEEGLTGAIPSELNKLSNLKGISLAFNSLTSLPNLGNLSQLERLILEGNPMEGHGLPSWVGQLTNLKNVWIPDMQLGGTIPDLSALTKLRIFQAPKNNFTGELPAYFIDGTMPEINMLALAWNNLSGSIPEFGQTNLAMFTVDGNSLSGQIPSSITSQTGMINLGLGWNDFEGALPSDLTDMYRLRYIRANGNNLTGTVPLVDVTNEKLQFIHMQSNNLSKEIPTKLAEVGNLPKFQTLDVSSNSLDDADIQPLINELESDGNLDILNY